MTSAVVWAVPFDGGWRLLVGVHHDGTYREAELTGWLDEATALDALRRLTVAQSLDGTRLDLMLETA